MFTTETIQRTRSRTITKVAVGTTFSIFLHKINYLPGAIHVSLKYLSLLLFFTVSHFWLFCVEFFAHDMQISFGIDFAALFSNKNMTLLNGFCSVQLLGVIDTFVQRLGLVEQLRVTQLEGNKLQLNLFKVNTFLQSHLIFFTFL